jgi:type IX secretion system PorP/SprF family membrane protein
MKRNTLILIAIALLAHISNAQQESIFGNAAFNPYLINPAAGGMGSVMQFETTYRTQWIGYNGGPRTIAFTGFSPIKTSGEKVLQEYNYHDDALFGLPERTTGSTKHIVGGKLMNDAIGPFSKSSVQLSYAIHLPLTKSINFGAGLSGGWSNLRLDESRVVLDDAEDNSYAQFLGGTNFQNILDANAGIVLYNKSLFLGLSTNQLLNNMVQFNDVETLSRYNRHFNLQGSYRFEAGNKIELEPTLLARYIKNSPLSADIGVRTIINNSSWLSLQYRTSNAIVVRVGSTLVKNLYLCYGYEHSLGALQSTNSGSHEIQLGIILGKNRNLSKEIEDSKQSADPVEQGQ